MADLNTCAFTGRLTRDAENKILPTGTALVTFDIANNTGWGEHKKVLFLKCNVWGKTGQGVFPYLKKGKNVAVTGEFQIEEWQGQDGMKHTKNVLNCNACILLADSGATNVPDSLRDSGFKKDGAIDGEAENIDEDIPY